MDNILTSIANNIHMKHLHIFSAILDPANPAVLERLLKELSECHELSDKCIGVNFNHKLMVFMVSNLDLYLSIVRQSRDKVTLEQYFDYISKTVTGISASLKEMSNNVDGNSYIRRYPFNSDSINQLYASSRKMQNISTRIEKSAFLNYIHSYHWHMGGIDAKVFLDDSHPFFKGILLMCKGKNPIINSNRNPVIKNIYVDPYNIHTIYVNGISFKEYKGDVYQYTENSSLELINTVYDPSSTFGNCHIPMVKKLYGNVVYDLIETMGM